MPVVSQPTVVSDRQLGRYAELIYDKVGIVVSPQKALLLSNRLRRRLRATGIKTFEDYYTTLSSRPAEDPEWEHFLQEITTHETYLFRDPTHWEWMGGEYCRELVERHRSGKRQPLVRLWSAACSTGDEAATMACCLANGLPKGGWKVQILGTDIGVASVAQAQRLTFNERAMNYVPELYRNMYFDRLAGERLWKLKAPLCEMMEFRIHNLLDALGEADFDVIMLKNVLIYFDTASKRRVLANVRKLLKPNGYLITGAAEGASDLLEGMHSSMGWLHYADGKAK